VKTAADQNPQKTASAVDARALGVDKALLLSA